MGLKSFFDGARRVVVHAMALGSNRLELFGIEWREEIERQMGHLTWLLAAFVFGFLALLLASVLVLIVFWNDYRITAATGLMLLYVTLFLLCVLNLKRKIRQSPAAFAATIEEFQRDRAVLLGKQEDRA